ncbi:MULTISPECIES: 2,4'-dihydroxyacetophenone dioxygenase family protein [Gammaproteobacteria]|jgi:quercetin dioxygenase-like cupin family protein|uniref:2,4'-dihydroxyacetophenone dioxygenase family protein n=1 Tax=Gammaproteobacteria TaxID=1236 RepID=UPI0018E5C244|nr:2,4'-dihydroxyacetophenone dioxygenase family protein [Pseudomonas sp. S4_EA_1b]EKT4554168.1 2,4'-dihydroxyacetophenone dioxygenase family protein [Pseudomonas putida]MBI6602669.1 2,4'-dihydroxyacetophenone dioxygenase family protein [Pseudomonas sp. S4_EA_1b]|tara:strand:- start:18 stop:536 length:519 start_codon:yes stop_codon:yes gene_type:complete
MLTNIQPRPNSAMSEDDKRVLGRHDQFGIADLYLNETESVFHPWVGDVWLKPLRFDVRNSLYVTILWAKKPSGLGRHRHRGPVTAYTLEGSWRYEEYDWVAQAGDFVQENPGVIHTLTSDTGTKALFFVQGSLEFYDEEDKLTETQDVFGFMDMYIRYCEENGVPFNDKLVF